MVDTAPTYSVAARLRSSSKLVIDRWVNRVREELPMAKGQSSESALVDDLPKLVEALARELESTIPGLRSPSDRALFAKHVEARSGWSNYSIEHLVREYGILRKVLFATLEEHGPLSSEDRNRILDFIEEGIRETTARFAEIQTFHERLELQYLKLIEQLVAETAHARTVEHSLERLLEVVIHGIRAQVGTVMLYDRDTLEMRLASDLGPTPELARAYRAALTLSAIAQPSTGSSALIRCIDTSTLEPEARKSLEALEVQWLLVLHLPARGLTPGTLCFGFREKRVLDSIELRLFEVLADRLALILASVELHDESDAALRRAREQKAAVEAEKAAMAEEQVRREELIATISHDLRNPLSVAKMSAEILKNKASSTSGTEPLAEKILRSIDRSDRMIHDLLDSYRIRAGKRMPLSMERYSMAALAGDVIKEMTALHGDRFRLHVTADVNGYWSLDGMRRVLENLLSNAVKYGAPGSPINVTVEEAEGKMRLSVNNHGAPLSSEEQKRILQPYERGRDARRSGRGWGIGLTLVRGIIDAHGGTVRVLSSAEDGTTFIVENPLDSRPFQENAD
jgi:signal transduction histidine kinase